MTCSCRYTKAGGLVLLTPIWEPGCQEHGIDSDWWNSEEQKKRRKDQSPGMKEWQAKTIREYYKAKEN